jgi:hypothetical protein
VLSLCFGFEARSTGGPSAIAVLESAFENRYGAGIASIIELKLETKTGSTTSRTIETISTLIDGRMHSIGRLTEPPHLRGMTILSIEAENRDHDAFLYLPSSQMVRRISTAQRADSFFGTDVTFEDLERQRSSDFVDLTIESIGWNGEPAFAIEGHPKRGSSFAKARFIVSRADSVILMTEYFKRSAEAPFRIVEIQRDSVRAESGHSIPTRFVVRNLSRHTNTTVELRDLVVNPEIDHALFSIKTLSSEKRLPVGAY